MRINRYISYSIDLFLIGLAWLLSYSLRYQLEPIPQDVFNIALKVMPVVVVSQILGFFICRLHRITWRYTSIIDLKKIVKAIFVGCSLAVLCLFFTRDLQSIPRSIFPFYTVVLFILVLGVRVIVRIFYYKNSKVSKHKKILKKAIIIGAGMAGESLVRDMLRSDYAQYVPNFFIDDDRKKYNKEIHGVRVIGDINLVTKDLILDLDISAIFIAIPSATTEQINKIHTICKATNVLIFTLPGLNQLIDGNIGIDQIKKISIEDLLNRDQVKLDWKDIQHNINDQTILITGSGGSIGSEVCRQISKLKPKQIIAIDHAEFNLFKLEQDLIKNNSKVNIKYHLIDIKDYVAVNYIFDLYKPNLVFHAAAYKHVPLLQEQIRAAVSNNILGTKVVADAAIKYKTTKFILVSTDKAVNPENIMGTTKRAAEIICQSLNTTTTKFITVRFGNVLDSAGSVVPIFKQQIADGGPVTVTHPDITRFFMLIPEAAQLILQASCIGNGGEIFVLDMGKSIKIIDLAKKMIFLSGKELDKDLIIKYTGLRPGEKLYEELFYDREKMIATKHTKIMQAITDKIDKTQIEIMIEKLADICDNILYKNDFRQELNNVLEKLVRQQ